LGKEEQELKGELVIILMEFRKYFSKWSSSKQRKSLEMDYLNIRPYPDQILHHEFTCPR
jgi:hypothetical protein